MKFFTKALCQGELSEGASEELEQGYQKFLEQNFIHLTDNLKELSQMNLHDGLIESMIIDVLNKEVKLQLVCGDQITGYFDLVLSYHDVGLSGMDLNLMTLICNNVETELLHDEIDVLLGKNKRYVHRLLFWPDYRELEINFGDLKISINQRKDRNLMKLNERLIVKR